MRWSLVLIQYTALGVYEICCVAYRQFVYCNCYSLVMNSMLVYIYLLLGHLSLIFLEH